MAKQHGNTKVSDKHVGWELLREARGYLGFHILHLHALVFQRTHRFLTHPMMSLSGNCYQHICGVSWRRCHRPI